MKSPHVVPGDGLIPVQGDGEFSGRDEYSPRDLPTPDRTMPKGRPATLTTGRPWQKRP